MWPGSLPGLFYLVHLLIPHSLRIFGLQRQAKDQKLLKMRDKKMTYKKTSKNIIKVNASKLDQIQKILVHPDF